MDEQTIDTLFEDLIIKRKELVKKLPYDLILLDEAKINENGHTSILVKILKFSNDGKYPFLESFFQMMEKHVGSNVSIECKPSENTDGSSIKKFANYIDGCITKTKTKTETNAAQYAVIIENKIQDAIDQEGQIDRYVCNMKGQKYNDNEIFVIYLTNDGTKEVDNKSFFEQKGTLEYDSNMKNGRFVMMNYRDHILPWLERDVLPYCQVKDQSLISGLQQYISFFKHRYNLTKELMEMHEELGNSIYGKLEKNLNGSDKYSSVNELEKSLNKAINQCKNRIKKDILENDVFNKIKTDIESYDSSLNFDRIMSEDKDNECIYFRIYKDEKTWTTMCIVVGFYRSYLFVQISRRDENNIAGKPIKDLKFKCLDEDTNTYFGSKAWEIDFEKALPVADLKNQIIYICNEINKKGAQYGNSKNLNIMSIDPSEIENKAEGSSI